MSTCRRRRWPPTGAPAADIPADQLARLRTADALLHVVRAFEDPSVPHPDGSVDAWRDIERLELEFVLADLAVVEKRVDKLRTSGRHGTPAERESNEREQEVLERILPALTAGRPIRDMELSEDDAKRIRGFRFLTEKPVLVLLNIGESDIPGAAEVVAGDREPGHPSGRPWSRRSRRASRWRSASCPRRRPPCSARTWASRAPAWSGSSG